MDTQVKKDLKAGAKQGALIAALVTALAAPLLWGLQPRPAPSSSAPAAVSTPPAPITARFGDVDAPPDVRLIADWSVAQRDHGAHGFAIVDKRRAHLYVFDAEGRLQGHTPVLLGYAPGDDTVPGIGQRPIELVRPAERTTPAGRFQATSGRNLLDEDVIWVDYGAAVSMHRVRTTNASERRLERLASPTTADNRISYGCINLPPAFFEQVAWPLLGKRAAVVYVLPEVKPLAEVFPQAAAWAARGAAAAAPASRSAGKVALYL